MNITPAAEKWNWSSDRTRRGPTVTVAGPQAARNGLLAVNTLTKVKRTTKMSVVTVRQSTRPPSLTKREVDQHSIRQQAAMLVA